MNENAFVSIVQTRPCPTFGRPVHHFRLRPGTSPHALRIPPHDGHPALRKFQEDGFRSALAVSNFRLRAQLDFSIPSFFPGQRGITPTFGYSTPHPSARGTLTLLNNALPSAHYEQLRPSITHWYSHTHKFSYLYFFLSIMMTGSRSSQRKPSTESRSLYAGHHLHSIRNTLVNCSRGPRTPPVLMSIL